MMPIEYVAQMGPMLILGALTVGLLAEMVSRAGGYGLITDMIVGLAGSLVVGGLFCVLISSQVGMIAMALIGGAGGALAILAQRTLWRSVRSGV